MTSILPHDVFLIVAEDLVVAEDLRQSIEELALSTPIIVAHSHEDALRALDDNTRAAFAVVATTIQSFANSALAGQLSKSETHIMLTEPWDTTLANERGWAILPFPFTSHDVHALIGKNV